MDNRSSKKEILPSATTQMTDLICGSQKPNSQMQRIDWRLPEAGWGGGRGEWWVKWIKVVKRYKLQVNKKQASREHHLVLFFHLVLLCPFIINRSTLNYDIAKKKKIALVPHADLNYLHHKRDNAYWTWWAYHVPDTPSCSTWLQWLAHSSRLCVHTCTF